MNKTLSGGKHTGSGFDHVHFYDHHVSLVLYTSSWSSRVSASRIIHPRLQSFMVHDLPEAILASSPSHSSAPPTPRNATVMRATGGTDASLPGDDEEDSNSRARGPFRPRNATKGTSSYQLRQFAEATLGSGSLRKAVKLPEGEDLNEWLAVNGKFGHPIAALFQSTRPSPLRLMLGGSARSQWWTFTIKSIYSMVP